METTVENVVPTVDESGEPIHLPFDEAFQKGLTALALRDTAFMRRCSHLLFPAHFDDVGNAGAVQVALRHFKLYGSAIDPASLKVTVADAIEKKIIGEADKKIVIDAIREAFSHELPSSAPLETKLAEFARHQAVTAAILRSADALNKDDFDGIENAMRKALDVGVNEESEAYDYYKEIDARTTERKEKVAGVLPPRGITTGVMGLDDVLYHRGWGRKELSVLMAGPKQGKCIKRDSLLFTENGLCEIGELVPESLAEDTCAPYEINVLGRNGLEKASHVYNSGLTKTKRIMTKHYGLEIEGTHHHPMLVLASSGDLVWKQLQELRLGDYLVVQRGAQIYGSSTDLTRAQLGGVSRYEKSTQKCSMEFPAMPNEMTPDLAEWMGMIAAEGYVRAEEGSICFTQKDQKIMDRYVSLSKKLFGKIPTISVDSRGNHVAEATMTSRVLTAYLVRLGMVFDGSGSVVTPWSIRCAPRECVVRFVATVLGLEGCVRHHSGNKFSYDLTMASQKLIRQLQMFLLNEGIGASYSEKMSMATNGTRIKRKYYRLRIANANALVRLREVFGVYEDRKNAILARVQPQNKTVQNPLPVGDLILEIIKTAVDRKVGVYALFGSNFWMTLKHSARGLENRRVSYFQCQKLLEVFDEAGFTCEALERLRKLVALNYAYDQVDSIEEGECVTVDLTVPGTHSFFANGLISHNTLACCNFAANASKAGFNVLYATLEVSARIISERLDACISDTAVRDLNDNIIGVEDKVRMRASKSGRLLIHEFPSGSMTPGMLRRLIEKYRNRGLIFDLVVVDYADIMAPDFRTDNVIENSKEIYIGLRAIAFEFDCALLTATQANREGAKAITVKAEHVAEDFNKIRTADLVISINASEEERNNGDARLYFAASRNQESGFTVRVKQNLKKMQFITSVVGIE